MPSARLCLLFLGSVLWEACEDRQGFCAIAQKASAFLIQGLPRFLLLCFFLPQMQPCHKHKGESHQPEIVEVGREEAGSLKILHEPWAGSLQKNNYLPV